MGALEFVVALVVLAMGYRLIMTALERRNGGPARPSSPEDEFQIMRDIQAGLLRMDQRIEALETLLADQIAARKATAPK